MVRRDSVGTEPVIYTVVGESGSEPVIYTIVSESGSETVREIINRLTNQSVEVFQPLCLPISAVMCG